MILVVKKVYEFAGMGGIEMTLQECNILLVDDEPELLTLVGKLLKKEGYQHIHMAAGCAEAMWYTQENDYQLVLLDIMLPDGDGFRLSAGGTAASGKGSFKADIPY